MRNRIWQVALAVLVGFLFLPVTVQAREHGRLRAKFRGESHGRYYGPEHGRVAIYSDVRVYRHGDDDYQGDDDEGYPGGYYGYAPAYYGPPGWYHGRKVGWRGCGLPPGLAKKYGCAPYYYGGYYRPYYRPGGTAFSVTIVTGR